MIANLKWVSAVCCVSLIAAFGQTSFATDAAPQPVEIWSHDAPGATGDSAEDKPAITAYLPDADKATGGAILICPGGGFMTRCIDFEGVLIEQYLRERGIAGFVLRYRIRPLYGMKDSLADAQRGMQYLRAHAGEYHIMADKIGIIGFSAGAELAASASMHTLAAKPNSADPLERFSSRPDYMILAYGSSPMPAASSETVDASALPPPTFMFCTAEDPSHLGGMLNLYTALRRARVPVESHFFATGEHGVGFAQGDPTLGEWPRLMYNWVRASGFLTNQPRVAVRGLVKVDGEPLPRGAIILTPIDLKGAPPVIGYVFNTGPTRGEYALRDGSGPVPGKYRVEIRQDATRWLSNSRDPLALRMQQKQRSGTLTDDDRKEWNEATRKRDLTPSIEGQRVYRKARPTDRDDLIVEIKPGAENHIDVEISTH